MAKVRDALEGHDPAKLDINTFGEIIDRFIEENHIQMLIDLPEGEIEPTLVDNVEAGGVIQFYILLASLKSAFTRFMKDLLDRDLTESFIDQLLKMVKADLMDAADLECSVERIARVYDENQIRKVLDKYLAEDLVNQILEDLEELKGMEETK